MAHVNLLKQVEIDDRWVLRSIPKKANGQRDWSALPDGNYFIEFREKGKRRRLPAGATVAQALEVQRRKHAELEAVAFGIIMPRPRTPTRFRRPPRAFERTSLYSECPR
jgi:hypothetical protein